MRNHNGPQCVVLIGGLGARLGQMTQFSPKPLLKIKDKPFLVYLLEHFMENGFRRFLLLAGYRAEVVREYFSTKAPPSLRGAEIDILSETQPLGTAGALRAAAPRLDDFFLLSNGDSICIFDLSPLCLPYAYPETLARMALFPVMRNTRYGKVDVEGGKISGFRERPVGEGDGLMNAGLYWMSRGIIDHLPNGKSSLEEVVFPKLAIGGLLEYYKATPSYFIDIGVLDDIERARLEMPSIFEKFKR